MARETEVYFTDYTKKTNNSKLGRPSANLNYDIRVRVDDKLNTRLEEYAKKRNTLKATAIRGILSSFFAQGSKNDEIDNKGAINMSVNSTNTLRFTITAVDNLTRAAMTEKYGTEAQKMFWENTFIKKQIYKRIEGNFFDIQDHIKAMVYSMLSTRSKWSRLKKYFDIDTGEIIEVDKIFGNYRPEYILSCNPDELVEQLKSIVVASQSTAKQMRELISVNIPKLLEFERNYGSIDNYYRTFIEKDNTLKSLVHNLSDSKSEDKFSEMAVSLVAEYLRNIGYDIANPNGYTKTILGCEGLGLSDRKEVSDDEVFDMISEIADLTGRHPAEVDYILWLACSEKYI